MKIRKGYNHVCYYKSAVSVIENVVYAHDAERKWIQNHPIVLYDAHLIEEMMTAIVHDIFNEEYLKENYLTNEGIQVSGIGRMRRALLGKKLRVRLLLERRIYVGWRYLIGLRVSSISILSF